MSWLARSLVNSLGVDDDDDEEEQHNTTATHNNQSTEPPKVNTTTDNDQIESSSDSRGVKEDLSELTKTLTRQLWGVASFLAPPLSSESSQSLSPPPPPPPPPTTGSSFFSDWNRWDSVDQPASKDISNENVSESSESARIAGIRNDFAEIGGRFRTGISRISNHKAVSEFSKIASTFLPFGSEEDRRDMIGDAVGVTNEVLAFAKNISMHPETWLDFPLADEEDSDDFDMSDAQQEHALAVECLAPRLAALRIELCPSYMSEGCFWKIYFVLLHPRLNKHDAELLSTPQIVEARAMLMQDIQSRTKSEPEWSGKSPYARESSNVFQQEHHHSSSDSQTGSIPLRTFASEPSSSTGGTDFETDKHPVVSTEMQVVDKSVVEEEPVIQNKSKDVLVSAPFKTLDHKFEDDDDGEDDWLQDESSEMAGFSGTTIPLGNEEDVSFSDLEDDDDDESKSTSSKTVTSIAVTHSTKDSRDWIQLSRTSAKDDHSASTKESHGNKSENKDNNDWLDVDEIDIA